MIISGFLRTIISTISRAIAYILIIAINLIRPLLGPMNICPFTIGCTQYALQQLSNEPLLSAMKNITQRLVQCHPFGSRKQ